MTIKEKVLEFIIQPFPLWETDLTTLLVENEFRQLNRVKSINKDNYTTEVCLKWGKLKRSKANNGALVLDGNIILERPSPALQIFYDECGLVTFDHFGLKSAELAHKLESAFCILRKVTGIFDCVSLLVRRVQILEQEDQEIDVSYSHPKISFSIFISVCKDSSEHSNIRVAESILHESMHLKLTLMESIEPLVVQNSKVEAYSPWRDEQRPVQGVLHGLFVFRCIHDFYKSLLKQAGQSSEVYGFILSRINQIRSELNHIRDFKNSEGLTVSGKELVLNLTSI